MSVEAISSSNSNKKVLSACLGAAVGAAARYVVPNKGEMKQMFNKDAFKNAAKKASTASRAQSRSILKYAGFGAVIGLLANTLIKHKTSNYHVENSKIGALLDSSECASEIMWLA